MVFLVKVSFCEDGRIPIIRLQFPERSFSVLDKILNANQLVCTDRVDVPFGKSPLCVRSSM